MGACSAAKKRTTLAKAWLDDRRNHVGQGANAKNMVSKLRYWQESRFATWALPAIHDWDLIEWRRDVLDEDQAEDREPLGPDAECSAQTVIHRLNALSKLIQIWSRAHRIVLSTQSHGACARPNRTGGPGACM